MAQLTAQTLVESGSVAGPPERRDIEWHNPEGEKLQAHVYVRKASYHTITYTWKQAEASQEHLAARIVAMTCDESGAPIFTMADILGNDLHGPICDTLFLALITAVNEVNSGKPKPPTTSGSN
jgi:hypothetical protein